MPCIDELIIKVTSSKRMNNSVITRMSKLICWVDIWVSGCGHLTNSKIRNCSNTMRQSKRLSLVLPNISNFISKLLTINIISHSSSPSSCLKLPYWIKLIFHFLLVIISKQLKWQQHKQTVVVVRNCSQIFSACLLTFYLLTRSSPSLCLSTKDPESSSVASCWRLPSAFELSKKKWKKLQCT